MPQSRNPFIKNEFQNIALSQLLSNVPLRAARARPETTSEKDYSRGINSRLCVAFVGLYPFLCAK